MRRIAAGFEKRRTEVRRIAAGFEKKKKRITEVRRIAAGLEKKGTRKLGRLQLVFVSCCWWGDGTNN